MSTIRFLLTAALSLFLTGSAAAQFGGEVAAPIHWRYNGLQIPYRWSAGDASQASEVVLYVKADQDFEWREVSRSNPSVQFFNYSAPGDGEYRFAVRTIDRQGAQSPPGPLTAEIFLIVDTRPPRLSQLTATQDTVGGIRVEFDVAEERLDANGVTVQALDPTTGQWQNLTATSLPTGVGQAHVQATGQFAPGASSRIQIRASVRDQAGNVQEAGQEIGADASSFAPPPFSAPAYRGLANAAGPALAPPANVDPFLKTTPGIERESRPAPASTPIAAVPNASAQPWGAVGSLPTVTAPPLASSASSFAPTPPPNSPPAATHPVESGWGPASNSLAVTPRETAANQPWPAETTTPVQPAGPFHAASLTQPNRAADSQNFAAPQLPELSQAPPVAPPTDDGLQILNGRRFALDYSLENVGRWGVAKVELWTTRDAGQTWKRAAIDHDNQSPVNVEVPEEGEYGFKIVVSSVGGYDAAQPQPGEAPEIRVRVDLTAPAVIFGAVDQGEGYFGDQLSIGYQATDNNLRPQPISLYYSDRPDGQWIPIATNLDNSGQYLWKLQRHLPKQFYLQVEAWDRAGNVSRVTTPAAISVTMPQPAGRIGGIRSLETATGPNYGPPAR